MALGICYPHAFIHEDEDMKVQYGCGFQQVENSCPDSQTALFPPHPTAQV